MVTPTMGLTMPPREGEVRRVSDPPRWELRVPTASVIIPAAGAGRRFAAGATAVAGERTKVFIRWQGGPSWC